MARFAPPALLRKALASDLVDRLTAPHGVDRYLELVDPTWTVREVRAALGARLEVRYFEEGAQ